MSVGIDGNVGIGTTGPGAKLEVNGDTGANSLVLTSDTGAFGDHLFSHTQQIIRNTAGGNSVKFDADGDSYLNGGNVGIGTTGPNGPLEVRGNEPGLNYAGIITVIDETALAADIGAKIVLGSTYTSSGDTTGGAYIGAIKENATTANYAYGLGFGTRAHGGNLEEAMRIDSDGNVGIGTTAPGALLHLKATAPTLYVEADINSNATLRLSETGPGSGQGGYLQNDGLSNIFNIGVNYGGTDKNAISILYAGGSSNGNVGIGTTTPIAEFEVAKDAAARIDAVETSGNVRARLSTNATQGFVGTVTNHPMAIFANNDVKMTVLADGNVGIGTTDPKTTLQVQTGDIYMPSAGTGIILKDDTNDACYRIKMSGGAMLNQQVVCP